MFRAVNACARPASRIWHLHTARSLSTAAPKLDITDSCVQRLRELAQEEPTRLRVAVDAGGCSGYQYSFELDNALNDNDQIFAKDNAEVVVDNVSLAFLEGATVDYENSLVRSSFVIQENPNSDASCGCGNSFVAKDLF